MPKPSRRPLILVLAITVSLVFASPAIAVPWLSVQQGRAAIYRMVQSRNRGAADWNVSRCFRLARNRVSCRWSATPPLLLCYGNAEAVARNGWVYARVVSATCKVTTTLGKRMP